MKTNQRSAASVAPSPQCGHTVVPEGEKVLGHTQHNLGEASPRALANRRLRPALTVTPAPHRAGSEGGATDATEHVDGGEKQVARTGQDEEQELRTRGTYGEKQDDPRQTHGEKQGVGTRQGEKQAVGQAADGEQTGVPADGDEQAELAINNGDEQGAPGTDLEFELSRATTRFALDLRLLSPVADRKLKRQLSEEEKDVRSALVTASTLATTARNVAMRSLYRRDSEIYDTWLKTHPGEKPRVGDVTYEKAYSYQVIRRSVPLLASGMAATLAREVDRKWVGDRFSVLVAQEKSPPHYRVGQPFPIRTQDARWVWNPTNKTAVVTVQLFSGGAPVKAFKLPIEARDTHQRDVLKNLAGGEWKAGEVRLERDRLRPAKWYMRVSYKRRVPRVLTGPTAAINRGMKCFLVALIEGGETWVYEANDIEAYLKQIQRRRREYQYGVKASNRVGRGRPRALRSIEHLTGKAERWRQTRCQVIARRLAKWLADRKVSKVYLDDFTGIRDAPPETLQGTAYSQKYVWERIQEWPYYQLGMRLEACLNEYGIACEKQDPSFNSMRCPVCGTIDPENKDLTNWKLRCKKGHYTRHLDIAFTQNALDKARGVAVPPTSTSVSEELGDLGGGEGGTARKGGRKRRK